MSMSSLGEEGSVASGHLWSEAGGQQTSDAGPQAGQGMCLPRLGPCCAGGGSRLLPARTVLYLSHFSCPQLAQARAVLLCSLESDHGFIYFLSATKPGSVLRFLPFSFFQTQPSNPDPPQPGTESSDPATASGETACRLLPCPRERVCASAIQHKPRKASEFCCQEKKKKNNLK